MGSILSTVTDDWLGLDPNGGGIYDVPVVGDVIDDTLGFDPGHSPLQHILRIAGYAGAAYGGAKLYNHIQNGGSVTDILPNWSSLSSADQATIAADANVAPDVLNASASGGNWLTNTGKTLASGAGSVLSFADDVLGLDPNGGGAFDSVTGVLNSDSTANNLLNTFTGGTAIDHLNNALGYNLADTTGAGGFDTGHIPSAGPYIGHQQALADAQRNRILGILGGDDAMTKELARQAAEATTGTFGSSGTLGSARHAQAASNAATDAILKEQRQALNSIPAAVSTQTVPYDTGVTGFKNEASRYLIDRYGDAAFGNDFSGAAGGATTPNQGGLLGDLNTLVNTAGQIQTLANRLQANAGGEVPNNDEEWF